MASELEIKWFDELSKAEQIAAATAWHFISRDIFEELMGNSDFLDACLDFFSEKVFDKPGDNSAKASAIRALAESPSILSFIAHRLEMVRCEDQSGLFFLIPVRDRFKFRICVVSFATRLFEDVVEKLEETWVQRKSSELTSCLNDRNYKTPRQFAEDWELPLREVNRRIKKDWELLEQDGSTKLDFPGADPVILLSPKAQDYLKMFTPSGRPTRDTQMSVLKNGLVA